MNGAAITLPLLMKASTPRSAVETASLQPGDVNADARAQTLAMRIGRGDEAAFGEFYELYHRRLFRFALVLARGDELLAGDATQAAFVTAAKKLRRAESANHLWNWLALITRQHLGKMWRQHRRDAALIGMAEVPDNIGPGKCDDVLEEVLESALRELDTDEQELVEWFYFDKLSHKEIAERLAATPKSVSSRLERARGKLRELIAQKLLHES